MWCRKKLIKTKGETKGEAGTPSESDRLGWEGRCPTRRGPGESGAWENRRLVRVNRLDGGGRGGLAVFGV